MIEWIRGSDGAYRATIHDRPWRIVRQNNFGYHWIVWMRKNIMRYTYTLREGKDYAETWA